MSQDIILKKPDFVKVLSSETNPQEIQLLHNSRNLDIIRILHQLDNIASLNDITLKFAEEASDDQAKSESTIYRALQDLKSDNIVYESGQRVIEGKTQSQTLYSLTSKYILINEPRIDWDSSRGKLLFKEILQIFQILYPDILIDELCLFEWVTEFQRTVDTYKTQLISSNDKEILDLISIWSFMTINDLMEYIGWLTVLLAKPVSQHRFQVCFQKHEGQHPTPNKALALAEESTDRHSVDLIREWPKILAFLPENDPARKYLSDPVYKILLSVFSDGILSMKDIIAKYNSKSKPVERNVSTIYRYVNTLKSIKLVKEVGQRVVRGKKATEKLYALQGRIISLEEIKNWDHEQRRWILEATIKIINHLFPELPVLDPERFLRFRQKATALEVEIIEKIQSVEDNTIVQLLYKYEWLDFWLIYTTFIDFYFFYNIQDLYGALTDCLHP